MVHSCLKKLLTLSIFIFMSLKSYATFAHTVFPSALKELSQSTQLFIVTSQNWEDKRGVLYLYDRQDTNSPWHLKKGPFLVALGHNGMGWDKTSSFAQNPEEPYKKEGDLRTPAGFFQLGPVFGHSRQKPFTLKTDYMPIQPATVCVDDVNSPYYNQIISYPLTDKISSRLLTKPALDREERGNSEHRTAVYTLVQEDSSTESMLLPAKVEFYKKSSVEGMYFIPQYYWGIVIQYNPQHIPSAGSCIFMHLVGKKTLKTGTAGCIALDKKDLQSILEIIQSKSKPYILILPQFIYNNIHSHLGLPSLV